MNAIATAHARTHYSWTLYASLGGGCVNPCKDHWINATGSWRFSYRQQQGISDDQSPPNLDRHRKKIDGCVFPGWADVLIFSCLPSTLSSHSSLTSFVALYLDLIPLLLICWRKKKSADRQRCSQTWAHPLLPFAIYFFIALPTAYMKGTTKQHWCCLSL